MTKHAFVLLTPGDVIRDRNDSTVLAVTDKWDYQKGLAAFIIVNSTKPDNIGRQVHFDVDVAEYFDYVSDTEK
jgi:hypothetical protein